MNLKRREVQKAFIELVTSSSPTPDVTSIIEGRFPEKGLYVDNRERALVRVWIDELVDEKILIRDGSRSTKDGDFLVLNPHRVNGTTSEERWKALQLRPPPEPWLATIIANVVILSVGILSFLVLWVVFIPEGVVARLFGALSLVGAGLAYLGVKFSLLDPRALAGKRWIGRGISWTLSLLSVLIVGWGVCHPLEFSVPSGMRITVAGHPKTATMNKENRVTPVTYRLPWSSQEWEAERRWYLTDGGERVSKAIAYPSWSWQNWTPWGDKPHGVGLAVKLNVSFPEASGGAGPESFEYSLSDLGNLVVEFFVKGPGSGDARIKHVHSPEVASMKLQFKSGEKAGGEGQDDSVLHFTVDFVGSTYEESANYSIRRDPKNFVSAVQKITGDIYAKAGLAVKGDRAHWLEVGKKITTAMANRKKAEDGAKDVDSKVTALNSVSGEASKKAASEAVINRQVEVVEAAITSEVAADQSAPTVAVQQVEKISSLVKNVEAHHKDISKYALQSFIRLANKTASEGRLDVSRKVLSQLKTIKGEASPGLSAEEKKSLSEQISDIQVRVEEAIVSVTVELWPFDKVRDWVDVTVSIVSTDGPGGKERVHGTAGVEIKRSLGGANPLKVTLELSPPFVGDKTRQMYLRIQPDWETVQVYKPTILVGHVFGATAQKKSVRLLGKSTLIEIAKNPDAERGVEYGRSKLTISK